MHRWFCKVFCNCILDLCQKSSTSVKAPKEAPSCLHFEEFIFSVLCLILKPWLQPSWNVWLEGPLKSQLLHPWVLPGSHTIECDSSRSIKSWETLLSGRLIKKRKENSWDELENHVFPLEPCSGLFFFFSFFLLWYSTHLIYPNTSVYTIAGFFQ